MAALCFCINNNNNNNNNNNSIIITKFCYHVKNALNICFVGILDSTLLLLYLSRAVNPSSLQLLIIDREGMIKSK